MKITLVKIDVEGAEYEVLQGMSTVLQLQRPIIIMELNNELQLKRGVSLTKIQQEIFQRYNYAIFSTNERGEIVEFQHHAFENSIFIPQEKIQSLAAFFA